MIEHPQRGEVSLLIDRLAPIERVRESAFAIPGVVLMGGELGRRRPFVPRELGEAACDLLEATSLPLRAEVTTAVSDVTWTPSRHLLAPNVGWERRWFTTEQMADAILGTATFECYRCHEWFIKSRSNAESRADMMAQPWYVPGDGDLGTLCDDCMSAFREWFARQGRVG